VGPIDQKKKGGGEEAPGRGSPERRGYRTYKRGPRKEEKKKIRKIGKSGV